MRRLQNDLGGFLADKKNCHNLQPSSSSSPSIYQIYLYTNIFIYILPNTSRYYVYLPLLLLLSWAAEYICLLCLWNLHLFATVCGLGTKRTEGQYWQWRRRGRRRIWFAYVTDVFDDVLVVLHPYRSRNGGQCCFSFSVLYYNNGYMWMMCTRVHLVICC